MALDFSPPNFLQDLTGGGNRPIAFSVWCQVAGAAVMPLISVTSASVWEHAIQTTTGMKARCLSFDGVGGSQGSADSTTSLTVDTWHHVFGVVYNHNDRKVWLDGGGIGTNTTSVGTPSTSALFLGVDGVGISNLDGRMAEAAIWRGGTATAMGAEEAGILAAGYSPLCLTKRLTGLHFYSPLVRDPNWNSFGAVLTTSSSPAVVAHPPIIYPGHQDNSVRSPGPFGNRLPPQGLMP